TGVVTTRRIRRSATGGPIPAAAAAETARCLRRAGPLPDRARRTRVLPCQTRRPSILRVRFLRARDVLPSRRAAIELGDADFYQALPTLRRPPLGGGSGGRRGRMS